MKLLGRSATTRWATATATATAATAAATATGIGRCADLFAVDILADQGIIAATPTIEASLNAGVHPHLTFHTNLVAGTLIVAVTGADLHHPHHVLAALSVGAGLAVITSVHAHLHVHAHHVDSAATNVLGAICVVGATRHAHGTAAAAVAAAAALATLEAITTVFVTGKPVGASLTVVATELPAPRIAAVAPVRIGGVIVIAEGVARTVEVAAAFTGTEFPHINTDILALLRIRGTSAIVTVAHLAVRAVGITLAFFPGIDDATAIIAACPRTTLEVGVAGNTLTLPVTAFALGHTS